MKKASSRIREDIARLQEQLKQAEAREAERIGRIALKAGLGDLDVEEADFLSAFEALAERFRAGNAGSKQQHATRHDETSAEQIPAVRTGQSSGSTGEA